MDSDKMSNILALAIRRGMVSRAFAAKVSDSLIHNCAAWNEDDFASFIRRAMDNEKQALEEINGKAPEKIKPQSTWADRAFERADVSGEMPALDQDLLASESKLKIELGGKSRDLLIPATTTCPVCGVQTKNRYVGSRFFQVTNFGWDRYPIDYVWNDAVERTLVPHHYFIWYCGQSCFYADTSDVFRSREHVDLGYREWVFDISFKQKSSLLRVLCEKVTPPDSPLTYEDAVRLHTLSTFFQHNGPRYGNPLKQAQCLLRMAWLLREGIMAQNDTRLAISRTILRSAIKRWDECPVSEGECMSRAAHLYARVLAESTDIQSGLRCGYIAMQINRLMGRLDKSKTLCEDMLRLAMRRRTEMAGFLSRKKGSGTAITQAESEVNFLKNMIEGLKDLRGTLKDEKETVEEVLPDAEASASVIDSDEPDILNRELIIEQNFPPQIARLAVYGLGENEELDQ